MTTNIQRVPKLRFPEFEGEWRTEQLKDITTYVDYRGKTPEKTESGVFLVTAKNIKPGYIDYSSSKEYIAEEKYNDVMSRGIPAIDDVLLTTEAPVGNVASVDRDDIALAQRVIKFRGVEGHAISQFIKHLFMANSFQAELAKKASGGTVKGIKGQYLHKIDVDIPSSVIEQQKIASFLTSIDRKIEALTKKKVLLEQYKKGMMQKLFSQEIRFTDEEGNDYPEWEEKKLGEVSMKPSYGMNAASKKYDGLNKYIRITDIDEHSHKFNPSPLTSPTGELDQKYVLKEGDIVFARTGASTGKTYVYNKNDGIIYFAGFLIKFSIDGQNPVFIHLQTLTYRYRKWVGVMSIRSGQPGINADEYGRFKVYISVRVEQNKIASFLSSIDSKIELVGKDIENMQTFKKGLLQQMFV